MLPQCLLSLSSSLQYSKSLFVPLSQDFYKKHIHTMFAPSFAHKNAYSSRHSRRRVAAYRKSISATRTLAASTNNRRQKKFVKKKKQSKRQAPYNLSRSHDEDDVSTANSIPHLANEDGGCFHYIPSVQIKKTSAETYAALSRRQKRLLRKKLEKIGVPPKICVSHQQNHHTFGSDDDREEVSAVSVPFYYASDDQSCFMDDSENMNLPFVSLHQVLQTAKERDSQSLCLIRMLEEQQHGKKATSADDDDDSSCMTACPFEISFPNNRCNDYSFIKLRESEIFDFLAAMLEYDGDKWTFEIQLWPPSGVSTSTTGEHVLDDLAFLVSWSHHKESSSPLANDNDNRNSEQRKPWQSDWAFGGEDDGESYDDESMNDFNVISFDFLDE